jgi:hypothetical protein
LYLGQADLCSVVVAALHCATVAARLLGDGGQQHGSWWSKRADKMEQQDSDSKNAMCSLHDSVKPALKKQKHRQPEHEQK